MTTTAKLPESLESALRQRCQQERRSISEILRDALSAYLARQPELDSPWAQASKPVQVGRLSASIARA